MCIMQWQPQISNKLSSPLELHWFQKFVEYSGEHWDKDGTAWGSFITLKSGEVTGDEYGDRGHHYSNRNHNGFAYGSKGAADGFSEFAKQIADEHVVDALEAGEHALSGEKEPKI